MGREFCNRENTRSVESLFSSSWYLIAVARPQWEWGNILTNKCIGDLQGKLGEQTSICLETLVINLSLFTQICMAIIYCLLASHPPLTCILRRYLLCWPIIVIIVDISIL